jgi:hypothetical protein
MALQINLQEKLLTSNKFKVPLRVSTNQTTIASENTKKGRPIMNLPLNLFSFYPSCHLDNTPLWLALMAF